MYQPLASLSRIRFTMTEHLSNRSERKSMHKQNPPSSSRQTSKPSTKLNVQLTFVEMPQIKFDSLWCLVSVRHQRRLQFSCLQSQRVTVKAQLRETTETNGQLTKLRKRTVSQHATKTPLSVFPEDAVPSFCRLRVVSFPSHNHRKCSTQVYRWAAMNKQNRRVFRNSPFALGTLYTQQRYRFLTTWLLIFLITLHNRMFSCLQQTNVCQEQP